jgi:hypothetical protein
MDSERQKRGGGIGQGVTVQTVQTQWDNLIKVHKEERRYGRRVAMWITHICFALSALTMMQVAMDSLTTLHEHASGGWERMARIIWWGIGKEVDGTQHKHTKETYADSTTIPQSSNSQAMSLKQLSARLVY